jgi:hypothetical protein
MRSCLFGALVLWASTAFVLTLGSGTASALTLDFNEFTPGHVAPVLETGGFEVDGYTDFTDETIVTSLLGSPAAACQTTTNYDATSGCRITLQRTDGRAFSLTSLNLFVSNEYYDGNGLNLDYLTWVNVFATKADGGSVSEAFSVLDGDPIGGYSPGPDTEYLSASFNSDWSNLTSVTFNVSVDGGTSYLNLDDIVVSVVPIPAPLVLFGSALATV